MACLRAGRGRRGGGGIVDAEGEGKDAVMPPVQDVYVEVYAVDQCCEWRVICRLYVHLYVMSRVSGGGSPS
jgi:hypothetical protein